MVKLIWINLAGSLANKSLKTAIYFPDMEKSIKEIQERFLQHESEFSRRALEFFNFLSYESKKVFSSREISGFSDGILKQNNDFSCLLGFSLNGKPRLDIVYTDNALPMRKYGPSKFWFTFFENSTPLGLDRETYYNKETRAAYKFIFPRGHSPSDSFNQEYPFSSKWSTSSEVPL